MHDQLHRHAMGITLLLIILTLCHAAAASLATHETLQALSQTPNPTSEHRPLIGDCDGPPELIYPGRFIITLDHWYTLLQHQERIGFDMQPHVRKVWALTDSQYTYWAGDVDDTMLRAIFADPDVFEIACDAQLQLQLESLEDGDEAQMRQVPQDYELRR